jgi:hypothetical protein
MDDWVQNMSDLLQKDNLKGALEILLKEGKEKGMEEEFELEIGTVIGRLNRSLKDRRSSVLNSATQFDINLNRVRKQILDLFRRLKHTSEDHFEQVDALAPILLQRIDRSEQLILQNGKLDMIFKIVLFSILFLGLGILFFSIGSQRILEEKIYLGSVSMTGIFSSLYFYTKLRGLEIIRYGIG